MLKTNIVFYKGILFIRLNGSFNQNTLNIITNYNKEFRYIVLNINNLNSIDIYGINYLIKYNNDLVNNDGKLFICHNNKYKLFNKKLNCIKEENDVFNFI